MELGIFSVPSNPNHFMFYPGCWLLWSNRQQMRALCSVLVSTICYRRPNTVTLRNSTSILALFLKDNDVFSLMPRSLEYKQLALFSVQIPFSMSEDCSIRWVFSLDGTEDYFPSSFNVLPLSKSVFSPQASSHWYWFGTRAFFLIFLSPFSNSLQSASSKGVPLVISSSSGYHITVCLVQITI